MKTLNNKGGTRGLTGTTITTGSGVTVSLGGRNNVCKALADITVILDRSGSMESMVEHVVSGFNEFVKLQRDANISLAQFDHEYTLVYDQIPVSRVPSMTRSTFQPRGMTALNDALGHTIDNVGKRLSELSEANRPEKVVILVITDGYENYSSDYSRERVAEMIKHQRNKYNWEFVFIGANQDAILTGNGYNIPAQSSLTYNQTARGTVNAFHAAGQSVAAYTSNVTSGVIFDNEARVEVNK